MGNNVNIKRFINNAVKGVKSFVVNKAMNNPMNPLSLINSWGSQNVKTSSNAAEIQALMKKSPFEKEKDRYSNYKKTDPLGFQHVQYPADLTGNELGNWILFFTINSNLHKGKELAADLQLSKGMGMPKASQTDILRRQNIEESGTGGDMDLMRDQYKLKGITIPKISTDYEDFNSVSAGYKPNDMVTSAIALYMPPDIKVSYGVEWGTEEAMLAGDVSKLWLDIKDSEETGGDLIQSMLRHGTGIAIKNLQELLGSLGAGAGVGDWVKILGKNMGMAVNSHREQVFEHPNFREFSYQFKFFPRNNDETERVQNIITLFKYHMHPWKEEDEWKGRMFLYPSEFEIHYLKNDPPRAGEDDVGGINEKLHKISRCALKKCDVSYSPEGGNFKTFHDHAPVTYTIDLTFVELEFMTKQKILKGF